jgi:hypothetical protein
MSLSARRRHAGGREGSDIGTEDEISKKEQTNRARFILIFIGLTVIGLLVSQFLGIFSPGAGQIIPFGEANLPDTSPGASQGVDLKCYIQSMKAREPAKNLVIGILSLLVSGSRFRTSRSLCARSNDDI